MALAGKAKEKVDRTMLGNPSDNLYSEIKGLRSIGKEGRRKALGKAEAIALLKGSLQRRTPYNPRSDEAKADFKGDDRPAQWIHGHLSQDSRESWPKIDGNARTRALHKLAGMTDTMVDPDTNKRYYLLHRGVGPNEKSKFVNEETNTAHHKGLYSWTPDHSVATSFSNDPNANHTLSSWVHEDDIHAVPFQTGLHRPSRGGGPPSHEGLSRRIKDEREVIISNSGHRQLIDADEAFRTSIPHSKYRSDEGETTRAVKAPDGYSDDVEQASINTRINQKMDKSEAVAKLRSLRKDKQ